MLRNSKSNKDIFMQEVDLIVKGSFYQFNLLSANKSRNFKRRDWLYKI
jgi:hypothetical protein